MEYKTLLKKFLSIIGIIFVLFGIWAFNIVKSIDMSIIEKKIVFKPEVKTYNLISPLAKKAELGSFLSKDGTKLTYIRVKGDGKQPVIVFCHGNARNMTTNDNQEKIKFLVKNGYEVFTLDYRGFGKSGGEPDESGVYSDIDSFISFINQKYNISSDKIVIWGHSLGSAIAIDEASKRKFKAVIVEGAFTSADDMKNYRIKYKRNANPIHLFIRDYLFNHLHLTQKFASKDKVAKIKSPMLVIHAKNDEMIPVSMAHQLAKLKSDAKLYISDVGNHCSSGWQDKPILEFLQKLH